MYHMYFEIWSCSISSAPYELMKRKSVRPLLLKRCVQSTMSGDMHYTETVRVSEWVCCVLCDIIWLLKTQCTIYISCAHFFPPHSVVLIFHCLFLESSFFSFAYLIFESSNSGYWDSNGRVEMTWDQLNYNNSHEICVAFWALCRHTTHEFVFLAWVS